MIELLENEVQRHAMRKRAYLYTRQMRCSEVAARYLDVFTRVQERRSCNPRPIHQREKLRERTLDLAEIKLDHLEVLTDDTGIYQHARFNVPSPMVQSMMDVGGYAGLASLGGLKPEPPKQP